MVRKDNDSFLDSLLAEMTTTIRSNEKMDIVTFAHEVILNGDDTFRLYPTQCAILKAFYKEELNEEEEAILNEWLGEDRTTWIKDRNYISLVLEAGRRGSKCNAESSLIATTVGDITYGELHKRLNNNERIGIKTYNFKGDVVREYITYDLKSEINAYEPVYEIETQQGKKETVNENHPFLYWPTGKKEPKWVTVKELKYVLSIVGTKRGRLPPLIAVSGELDVWGEETLTTAERTGWAKKLRKKCKLPEKFNRLSKEETIDFFREVYNLMGNLNERRADNVELHLLTHKCHSAWLTRVLAKLGCVGSDCQVRQGEYSYIISAASDIYKFYEYIGYDDEIRSLMSMLRLAAESISDKCPAKLTGFDHRVNYSSAAVLEKQAIINHNPKYYDIATNNVNWEEIKSIKYIGNQQTIALEVNPTHVIGSWIISHNSTLASIICLKEFYDLITLESPQRTWGLLPASPIAILVMAQSQAQVKETIFAAIRGYAENSTYFSGLKAAGFIDILAEEIRCPSKNIAIYAKHTNSKSLVGYSLKCMLLDEVARFETTGEEGKNKAFEIWRNVAAGGAAFGNSFKKVAISSAWEPGDPIEQFYMDAHTDPLTLGFKLTTFQVNLALKKGVTPVIVSDYATDFLKARREYEGIRFSKFNTFIDEENLKRAMKGVTTIDSQPCKIDITSKAGTRHYAGVNITRITPLEDVEQMQFCHIDPALKKDSAALAMAHVEKVEDKYKIFVDTLIKWEPHTDNNGLKRIVSYIDIENKLDEIHEARPLYRVTFDQWNSESFIQKLHTKGIDSQQVSCSREAQFTYYTLFRDLLAHDYIVLPRDTLWSNDAVTELSEMVLKPNRQIIHPYAGKDLGDAIVNVVYQVHQYMVRSGLNIMMGLSPMIIQSQTLARVHQAQMKHANLALDIGAARDRMYKIKRF